MELEQSNGDKVCVEALTNITEENSSATINVIPDKQGCFYCRQKATKYCSHCKISFYCDDEHGKIHRPDDVCFPFSIEYLPNVGNFPRKLLLPGVSGYFPAPLRGPLI